MDLSTSTTSYQTTTSFCFVNNNHKLDKNNDIVSPHDTQVGFLRIKASVLHLIKNFQSSPFLLFLHFT